MTKYILIALLMTVGVSIVVLGRPGTLTQPHSQAAKRSLSIYATGVVEGLTEEIKLRTEIAGRVSRILIKEGQLVRKGDLLVEIANEQYRHQVDLAKAELDVAVAKLRRLTSGARELERNEIFHLHQAKISEFERAKKTWETVQRLRETKAITQSEIDRRYYQLLALEAEVAAAKARLELINADARSEDVAIAQANVAFANSQLEIARVQLTRTQLRAPSDGEILELTIEEGESTGPNSLRAAVVMADTSSFFVTAYLDEYDALRVPMGCNARITADGLTSEIGGRLVSMSPIMGRKKFPTNQPNELHDVRTRKVRLQLNQTANLIIGLPVDVYFEVETPATHE